MTDLPLRGDIRCDRLKYPVGTPLADITEFEVWDGHRWIPSTEAPNVIIPVSACIDSAEITVIWMKPA